MSLPTLLFMSGIVVVPRTLVIDQDPIGLSTEQTQSTPTPLPTVASPVWLELTGIAVT